MKGSHSIDEELLGARAQSGCTHRAAHTSQRGGAGRDPPPHAPAHAVPCLSQCAAPSRAPPTARAAARPRVVCGAAGVCAQLAGRAHVVTRNAHVAEIEAFLAQHGLGSVPVHRVARPRSKAEVVGRAPSEAEGGGGAEGDGGALAVFVDDSISEHFDAEMRALPRVVRFLLARST